MVRITIDNSICRIEGLNVKQFRDLREVLSYQASAQAAYFSGSPHGRTRYLLGKRGDFPTGLLYIVRKHLSYTSIGYSETDRRVKPLDHKRNTTQYTLFLDGKALMPYPEQQAAALAAWKHGRGIISAPTGVGKSLIAGLICDQFQLSTLIVVPSLELKRQLTASLQSWFGNDCVGSLRGPRRLISVENVDALDPDTVLEGIDLIIIDEFHHSGARTYRDLNRKAWSKVYYKIGLTATPFRSNENERLLLESVLSQVIYRLTYKTAVEKGYIVPVEAYFIDLPKVEMKGNELSWPAVYSELVVRNGNRNAAIVVLLKKLVHSSTLCLVKEIKHGQTLSAATGVAFANGQDSSTRSLICEFNQDERKRLIGTTGVIGEGVDTKPAEFVILAAGGKSKTQFMQQIGRGVRRHGSKESCKVILFRDRSHKWLIQHFNACVKHLRDEYGVKPVRLSIVEEGSL